MSTPANLSGAVAIGIALDATAAARWVDLRTVNRAWQLASMIELVIIAFSFSGNITTLIEWLLLIGSLGCFYAAPLNALLQERGQESVGPGHAITIHNLFKNIYQQATAVCGPNYRDHRRSGVPRDRLARLVPLSAGFQVGSILHIIQPIPENLLLRQSHCIVKT